MLKKKYFLMLPLFPHASVASQICSILPSEAWQHVTVGVRFSLVHSSQKGQALAEAGTNVSHRLCVTEVLLQLATGGVLSIIVTVCDMFAVPPHFGSLAVHVRV